MPLSSCGRYTVKLMTHAHLRRSFSPLLSLFTITTQAESLRTVTVRCLDIMYPPAVVALCRARNGLMVAFHGGASGRSFYPPPSLLLLLAPRTYFHSTTRALARSASFSKVSRCSDPSGITAPPHSPPRVLITLSYFSPLPQAPLLVIVILYLFVQLSLVNTRFPSALGVFLFTVSLGPPAHTRCPTPLISCSLSIPLLAFSEINEHLGPCEPRGVAALSGSRPNRFDACIGRAR